MDLVRRVWSDQVVAETAMARLVLKLQRMSKELARWGASRTLPCKAAKDRIFEQIEGPDALEEAGLLDDEDRQLRDSLKANYNVIFCKEEEDWKQRSRDRWVKEGDRNTAYFQKIASGAQRRNESEEKSTLWP